MLMQSVLLARPGQNQHVDGVGLELLGSVLRETVQ